MKLKLNSFSCSHFMLQFFPLPHVSMKNKKTHVQVSNLDIVQFCSILHKFFSLALNLFLNLFRISVMVRSKVWSHILFLVLFLVLFPVLFF